MKLGFFIMPVHPLTRNYAETLREDREAFVLADRLGYSEGYCGEHLTDLAENIPSSLTFVASLAGLHVAGSSSALRWRICLSAIRC